MREIGNKVKKQENVFGNWVMGISMRELWKMENSKGTENIFIIQPKIII